MFLQELFLRYKGYKIYPVLWVCALKETIIYKAKVKATHIKNNLYTSYFLVIWCWIMDVYISSWLCNQERSYFGGSSGYSGCVLLSV